VTRLQLQLLTIVGEAVLEQHLITELKQLGAKGCTVSDVRGEGSRGARSAEFGQSNVKIETIVAPEVAQAILEHLSAVYFPHYAMIAYVENVQVMRGNKYV
jgi:nitrogen regulatory protein P-II 2